MMERDEVQYGSSVIAYSITRSARRKKTIELTLDGLEGVLIAAPMEASRERIREVVLRRAAWVLRHDDAGFPAPRPKSFLSGETLPYAGREVRMEIVDADIARVRLRFTHWAFAVTVPRSLEGEERREAVRLAFVRWYRRRAGERAREAVRRMTALGLARPSKCFVREQRQRWGSCAPDGSVRFNWRIAMADQQLVDYVVAHELAHLEHRDHSRLFWESVQRVIPDYRERRVRLRETGSRLSL